MTIYARSRRRRHEEHGFSLIELAVVLVIVGLLFGGGLAAFEANTEQMRRSEQERQFQTVRAALHGFAMSHGRLPCPDDLADGDPPDPDGQGDSSGSSGTCDASVGVLPWADLGVARRDAWGYPLIYHVRTGYADAPADPAGSSFTLTPPTAGVRVVDEDDDSITDTAPAVVISAGPQGGQIWTGSGFPCTTPEGFSADEVDNCDGNDTYVAAGFRSAQASEGRFDDMLIWLSDPVLKARMVDAGRLP